MRTNIEIDDQLLKEAMRASNTHTKKAAVEAALRQLVRLKKQERITRWFGKIQWEGDLKRMRQSRFLNEDGLTDRPEWHQTLSPGKRAPKKASPKKRAAAD